MRTRCDIMTMNKKFDHGGRYRTWFWCEIMTMNNCSTNPTYGLSAWAWFLVHFWTLDSTGFWHEHDLPCSCQNPVENYVNFVLLFEDSGPCSCEKSVETYVKFCTKQWPWWTITMLELRVCLVVLQAKERNRMSIQYCVFHLRSCAWLAWWHAV